MINKHSYGEGGFNTYKINPLFKDVKEYNKYLLSLIGIFVLLLTGIISYSYTNISYAKWSSSIESKNVLKLSVKVSNTDKSGANKPLLTSNMIPVYYDETSKVWKKADETNNNSNWYNYDNKMWANAVTISDTNRDTYLKASVGTTIPMDDINTMWVWIPRYTYTYFNSNTPQEIKIKFENDTNSSGTIKCTDAVGTSSTSETCTDSKNGSLKAGTSTYTHPAFTFGNKELTGIWVGKFEMSRQQYNVVISGPIIKPNVTSYRDNTLLDTYIYTMRESDNAFGFSTTDETHMMKNMEWGAVAYLSHSKYGINKEIAINSANTYTTGCGPQSEGSTENGSKCNEYNTALGQSASTTGNVYGIYDMSGGASEYVMGYMVDSSGKYDTDENDFLINFEAKYYDEYSYGSSETVYTGGKLGDATKEMMPTGTSGNWYGNSAVFPYLGFAWFMRGGSYASGDVAGVFSFSHNEGIKYNIASAHAVLSIIN